MLNLDNSDLGAFLMQTSMTKQVRRRFFNDFQRWDQNFVTRVEHNSSQSHLLVFAHPYTRTHTHTHNDSLKEQRAVGNRILAGKYFQDT